MPSPRPSLPPTHNQRDRRVKGCCAELHPVWRSDQTHAHPHRQEAVPVYEVQYELQPARKIGLAQTYTQIQQKKQLLTNLIHHRFEKALRRNQRPLWQTNVLGPLMDQIWTHTLVGHSMDTLSPFKKPMDPYVNKYLHLEAGSIEGSLVKYEQPSPTFSRFILIASTLV